MSKLIMLGTGHATVTKCYNTCFALYNGDEYFLTDGGGENGLISILEKKNIDIRKIKNVFVTHSHTDHIIGIIWLIRVICQKILKNQYDGILNIYGHNELIQKLRTLCELMLDKRLVKLFDDKIIFNIVENNETRNIMNMKITFFDIYSVKEKQFGFKANFDNVTLTCLGDEPLNEKCLIYAKDAAEIAQKLNVKKLVLYHTEDTDLKNRKTNYKKEAEKCFSGKIYVPDDLEEIILD